MQNFKLKRIGKLYTEDLKSLAGQSGTTKFVHAFLTSLTESTFAKNHGGQISLTTSKMSEFMDGFMSARMIRRQLNKIKFIFPNRYRERRHKFNQFIKLGWPRDNKHFKLIFTLGSDPALQEPSMLLMFSLLLDRAAFNSRCGEQFAVTAGQMTQIQSELGICKKTFTNHLSKLQKLNLISSLNDKSEISGSELLKQGFIFSHIVESAYRQCVKLQVSDKCKSIKNHRAYKVKDGAISRSDSGSLKQRSVIAQNRNLAQRANPLAEIPNPIAAQPCLMAAGWRAHQFSENSLEQTIAQLKRLASIDASMDYFIPEPSAMQRGFSFPQGISNRRF